MDTIEKVRILLSEMNETEKEACLKLFKSQENKDEKLKKAITESVKELKVGFTPFSTDDWKTFCRKLHQHCLRVKEIWKLIDRRNELAIQARSAKHRKYVQQMVDKGFQFDQIVIGGEPFSVVDNRVLNGVIEDDIPF